MDKELKEKWVAALRSGEFAQTTGALRNANGYCCLGVLHRVVTGEEPPTKWTAASGDRPECVDALGDGAERALAELNDEGAPFELIAGLIDEAA